MSYGHEAIASKKVPVKRNALTDAAGGKPSSILDID